MTLFFPYEIGVGAYRDDAGKPYVLPSVREAELKGAGRTAKELAARLRQVADDFLARENRHRPDYLDGILAPPIAPEEPA